MTLNDKHSSSERQDKALVLGSPGLNSSAVELYRDAEISCFLVGDLLVYRDVGSKPPEVSGWAAYVAAFKAAAPRTQRCLVVPRAGGLTARQREDTRRLIGARPCAVLTASLPNRCIITSLAWFGLPVRAFAPDAHYAALVWLERERLHAAVMRGLERYAPGDGSGERTRVA